MLKRNLIANYIGQGWTALMGLAFIPIYIKYLGIEAYGLIGLFVVLQAWLAVLDLGMGPTLNREMARFSSGLLDSTAILDLLRSIEVIVLAIATLITVTMWYASEWIAKDWLRTDELPLDTLIEALSIMGMITALRLIESIYRSSIIGLQKQVIYNVANSIVATLRAVGAIGILELVSPTIEVFFAWQALVSMLGLIVMMKLTYRYIPKAERRGKFNTSALVGISGYATGIVAITILSLSLTQIDKILLSKYLTLHEFGYYSFASVAASILYVFSGPITQAWFPKLSELHAENNQKDLILKFHQGAQLISVVTGSFAMAIFFFAEPLLRVWTQDTYTAGQCATLLSILTIGNLFNSVMSVPYQTQLAYGWTTLTVWCNLVACIIIIPALFLIVPIYGAEGAAWIWTSINAGYVIFNMHLMFSSILINEKYRWYINDVTKPLFSATIVGLVSSYLMPEKIEGPRIISHITTTMILMLSAAAFSAKELRILLLSKIRKLI